MSKIEQKIKKIEDEMANPTFWEDKASAQEKVKELGELKAHLSKEKRYDNGNAIMTIFAGAGGDDAEDWARILYDMYT